MSCAPLHTSLLCIGERLGKIWREKKRERNLGELLSRFKKATAALKETGGVPCGNNDYSHSENIL
jgi:hypothetical protein